MDSLRSHLLVASPQLPDPNFNRSVVLLLHHDDDGAFGVILNRPLPSTVGEIWELITNEPCDDPQPVLLGGPVEGPLMALHTQPDCSEREILPGVHFATDKEHLHRIVGHRERPYRLISGYSGWSGGQLEGELKAGGWMTLPATFDYIFASDDDLWKTVAQRIGEGIVRHLLTRSQLPEEPSLN